VHQPQARWMFTVVVVIATMVTGCSSSGKSSNGTGAATQTSGTTDGQSSSSGATSGPSTATGASGTLDVSKMCAAVAQADIQKLFKETAPQVTTNPGECDWGGGAVTVDIYLNDTTKQYYSGGAVSPTSGTSLSGVGDEAVWAEPVSNHSVPDVAAHKATTTCTVTPGLEINQTPMPYTGTAPTFTVTAAAALQYAQAEGQICSDIFRAG
jgi:hypothetical protein